MVSVFRRRHDADDIITPFPAPTDGHEDSALEHLKSLERFEKAHKLDPNLPIDDLNDVDAAIATGNAEKGAEIEHALMEDNSPYPEVGYIEGAVGRSGFPRLDGYRPSTRQRYQRLTQTLSRYAPWSEITMSICQRIRSAPGLSA
jgi:hypothetical protein